MTPLRTACAVLGGLLPLVPLSAQTLQLNLTNMGDRVVPAGDLDLDGADDVLLCTPKYSVPGQGDGHVTAYSGKFTNLLFTVPAPTTAIGFADHGATSIGDVNLDSSPDFAVAAPAEPLAGGGTGTVRVYSGANGVQLLLIQHPGLGMGCFGSTIARTGDIDGDGRVDFAVAAPTGATASQPGSVYLVSGRTGQILRVYTGQATAAGFGQGLDGSADFNLDGVLDLVISEPSFPFPAQAVGRIDVYSGQSGAILKTYSGASLGVGMGFGPAVHVVDDVDGDGRRDLATHVGATGSKRVRILSAASGATLFESPSLAQDDCLGDTMDGLHDVDGDGIDDLMVSSSVTLTGGVSGAVLGLSGATGERLFHLFRFAEQPLTYFISATALGDLDGDGIEEIATGFAVDNQPQVDLYSVRGDLVLRYGTGCSGSGGFQPSLDAAFQGATVQLSLTQALGGTPALLAFGFLPKRQLIAGGSCEFLLGLTAPVMPLLPLSGSAPGSGTLTLGAPWPALLNYVFAQAIIADPGTPRGYSASNALEIGRN